MTKLALALGAIVGVGKTYVGASEHLAYALPYQADFSAQRHPRDMPDGQYTRGSVVTEDSIFSAFKHSGRHPTVKEGSAAIGAASTLPADDDKILMGELGTGQRLRSIDYFRTVAFAGASLGGEMTAAEYFKHMKEAGLFVGNTTTAFPQFSLTIEDPEDSNFQPILLASEADTADSNGSLNPLAGLTFYNNRSRPLCIVAQVRGAVPNNSALILNMTMSAKT